MNKIGCPFLLLVEDARHLMKNKACNQPTTNGFCVDHAYCVEVLREASAAGYPRMEIAPGYFVRSGEAHWQAYAQRHRRERHGEMCKRLRELVRKAA